MQQAITAFLLRSYGKTNRTHETDTEIMKIRIDHFVDFFNVLMTLVTYSNRHTESPSLRWRGCMQGSSSKTLADAFGTRERSQESQASPANRVGMCNRTTVITQNPAKPLAIVVL